jgi:hypothetical protein
MRERSAILDIPVEFAAALRIVAWNVNHRARRKAIPAALPDGILSLAPDVIVLTEYVEGTGHDRFCATLEGGGLVSQFHTPILGGLHNQVLIASRAPATRGTFAPPDALPHAGYNFLHVRLDGLALDLMGLRGPMYET